MEALKLIDELLRQGMNALDISGQFNLPIEWVYAVIDSRTCTFND